MKLAKQEQKVTYIGMLIDNSGSMSGVREPTLSGFNEQLQVIKSMVGPDHQVYLTTAIFSEPGKFKILRLFVDPTHVELLSKDEYKTDGGSTALFDAMDEIIRLMEQKREQISQGQNAALVQFFTDGQENSSVKVKSRDIIKSRIEELTKTGHWTFTYMGVGSIDDLASGYGFSAQNITQFQYGIKGAYANTATNSAALTSYAKARSVGSTYSADLYDSGDTTTKDDDVTKIVKP
jgi:hypothetical protein